MKNSKWLPTLVAGGASLAVWALAASKGHAVEMLWLPAVMIGSSWPGAHRHLSLCKRDTN